MRVIDHALSLITNGISVFPCNPANKAPRIIAGFKAASTDPARVQEWFAEGNSLIGVPTGKASGIYVLDVDVKRVDGFAALAGRELPTGRVHWTPSGGAHYLFTCPAVAKTDSNVLAPGLDRRGDGGYVIWWPAHGGMMTDGPLPPTPVWMIAPAQGEPAAVGDPIGLSDDELREVLRRWDGDTYETWFTAGAALHHETGGALRGLDLWDWASREVWPGYPDQGRRELEIKWASFGRKDGPLRTLRSILPPGYSRASAATVFGSAAHAAPMPVDVVGVPYAMPHHQKELFSGCCYVMSHNKVLIPGGQLLDKARFDVRFGGYEFAMTIDGSKPTRSAWEAFTTSQVIRFPKADGLCFRPAAEPGIIIDGAVNLWAPIDTKPTAGDVAPWLHHLIRLFPDDSDRATITAYLAALVQYPGVKFQWWPLIQGVEGNGKSFILEAVEHAVGERYCHRPNASDIGGNGGKFTAWIHGKLIIGIEEIKTGHRAELLEILKPIITNSRIEIQAKGVDQVTAENRANGLLFSNHKDAITKTARDRRYAIFYTAQQEPEHFSRDGMDGDYFPRLYEWARGGGFSHINHWLRSYAIPDALNPAKGCHRAPRTSSTNEALVVTMGRVEQEVLDAIERCVPGMCGGWVSGSMLKTIIAEAGRGMYLTPVKRHEMMRTLGYVLHPGLKGGRTDNAVMPDGERATLYIKIGHISAGLDGRGAIALAYTKAQPGVFGQSGGARGEGLIPG